jgi:hypothetical protein
VSKPYKKPDLNAPRYRPKKLNLTNIDIYNKFLEENPHLERICLNKFKEVIKTFNGKIWQSVIESRDGVELPEQLGYIFIGTCPRKKSNVDFKKSEHYGVKIQNQNWESDQYVAKIFYTNYEGKYKFRNHELWGFTAVRDFKRSVGQTYPKEWKKYVMVDNMVRVSRIFRNQSFVQFKKKETKDLLQEYDEFNLD